MSLPRFIKSRRLPPLLLLIGLTVWTLFVFTAKVAPGELGLAQSLGLTYFVAIVLIVSSILLNVVNRRADYSSYFGLVSLFLALYTTPFLIDGTPYFHYTYRVLGYTNFILETGTYDPVGLPYLNWPGIMLAGAFTQLLSGIAPIDLLFIFPMVIKPLQLIIVGYVVYAFSKERFLAVFGSLVFLVFDWTSYHYYLPPSLGVTLFLVGILIIVGRVRLGWSGLVWSSMLLLVTAGMVVSHLQSTILFVAIIMSLFIIEKKPFVRGFMKRTTTVPNKNALAILAIVSGYILVANWVLLQRMLPGFLSSLGNIVYVFTGAKDVTDNAGDSYVEVILIKIIFTAIIGLILLVAIVYALWSRKGKGFELYFPLIGLICAGAVPLTIFASYSFEAITRAFEYMIPFLVIILAYSWRSKTVTALVVIGLLVAPVLFAVSAYGNADVDYVSRMEVRGTQFFYDTVPVRSHLYSYQEGVILMEKIHQYRWGVIEAVDGVPSWQSDKNITYMLYSDRDIERNTYLVGPTSYDQYLHDLYFTNTTKVYSTGSYELFKRI